MSSEMPSGYRAGKWLAGIIVSGSVEKVVKEVLRNNIESDTIIDSFRVRLGIRVISAMVADHAWDRVNARMAVVEEGYLNVQKGVKIFTDSQTEKEEKEDPNVIVGEIVSESEEEGAVA